MTRRQRATLMAISYVVGLLLGSLIAFCCWGDTGVLVPLPGNNFVLSTNQVVLIETTTNLVTMAWQPCCIASNKNGEQWMSYYRQDSLRINFIAASVKFEPPYDQGNQRFYRARSLTP